MWHPTVRPKSSISPSLFLQFQVPTNSCGVWSLVVCPLTDSKNIFQESKMINPIQLIIEKIKNTFFILYKIMKNQTKMIRTTRLFHVALAQRFFGKKRGGRLRLCQKEQWMRTRPRAELRIHYWL